MTADVVAPAYGSLLGIGRARRLFEALRTVARGALRFRPRCLILGHDDSFVREPRRLSLRCTACGRQTTGWAVGPGASEGLAPGRIPSSRKVGLDLALRVGPWTLRGWDSRGAARERERQRLVASASRAAEGPTEDSRGRTSTRPEPVGRGFAAGVAGEATAAVRTVAKWLT